MKLTYIIIITLFFKISSKEIRFPFKRHYNQKISEIPSQELMKKLHDSNMEIFIEIGSNSQKIPFYLRLDQYSFFTSCSEANIDKNLIKFMEKESTTLEKDSKEYLMLAALLGDNESIGSIGEYYIDSNPSLAIAYFNIGTKNYKILCYLFIY